MNTIIEPGLREKFASFRAEVKSHGPHAFERTARGGAGAEPGRPDALPVERFVSPSLHSETELTDFLAAMNQCLPMNLWQCALLACPTTQHREQTRTQLTRWGFPQSPQSPLQPYLDRLGIVAVSAPPYPVVLDWLSRLDSVSLIGDGARVIAPPHPLSAARPLPVGPVEAMMQLMTGGEELPDDIHHVREDSVRVAVIDTGIDDAHPALSGRVEAHFDFSGGQVGPVDAYGHGTHVAGIVAGIPPRDRPELAGIAPGIARLVDIQVWDPLGTTTLILLAGIGCAMEQGVDVLNLSMGTTGLPTDGTSIECQAIQQAVASGLVVCISAGNSGIEGAGNLSVPSDAPDAICVAAVDQGGLRADFSSMGPSANPAYTGEKPNVAAPGVAILSAKSSASMMAAWGEDPRYTPMDGTSMAAPMVSGLCALGIAYGRARGRESFDPLEITRALKDSAVNVGGQDRRQVGTGIAQAPAFLRAVAALSQRVTKPAPTKQIAPEAPAPPDELQKGKTQAKAPIAEKPAPKTLAEAPAEPPARKTAPAVTPTQLTQWENTVIRGVAGNVTAHAAGFLQEAARKGSGSVLRQASFDDKEMLRDAALALGHDLLHQDGMPVNREQWLVLGAGMIKRPVHCVAVKSFCGSRALEVATGAKDLTARHITDFLAQLDVRKGTKTIAASDAPVSVLVVAPGMDSALLEGLCATANNTVCYFINALGEDDVCRLQTAGAEYGPHAWLALLPTAAEKRLPWIEKCLATMSELDMLGDAVDLNAVSRHLRLPVEVIVYFQDSINRGAMFRMGPDSGPPRFIQRR